MKTRLALALAAALALPSAAAAQQLAVDGPLAAPAVTRHDAARAWTAASRAPAAAPATLAYAEVARLSPDRSEAPLPPREPLPSSRVEFSLPLATVGSVVGAAAGLAFGYGVLGCSDEGEYCGGAPDNAEYGLMGIGMALGATTGAHVGGLRRASKGSLGLTLAGAGVGSLPLFFAKPSSDNDALAIASLVGSITGAVLVDHVVRRPRS